MSAAQHQAHLPGNEFYEVRSIPGKGHGCFALKDIKRGTRILADEPLLIVPVAHYLQKDIQAEFDHLTPEKKKLYFSLHSAHSQDPKQWPSHVHESVQGPERQRIQEQHEARVGKEASLVSIFQTNCMEMNKGAAVFPNAARLNHKCNPKACFSWNSKIGKETIHAMTDIPKGEEITISYCDMTFDKPLRAWELKHYGFTCDCRACTEDENDENTFAYQSAIRRYRLQELDRETRFLRGSRLEQGAQEKGFVKKLLEMAALHQEEGDMAGRLAGVFLDIALVCEMNGDLKGALAAAVKAQQVTKDSRGEDFPDYDRFVNVVERARAKIVQSTA